MNLLDAMSLRHVYSDEGFERVEKLEGIVDRYEDRLGTYLVQITRRELLDPAERGCLEVPAYDHGL